MILEVFFTKSALPAGGQSAAESFIEETAGKLGQDLSGGKFHDMGSQLQWQREVAAGYDAGAFSNTLGQVVKGSGLRTFKSDYQGMASVNVRPMPGA